MRPLLIVVFVFACLTPIVQAQEISKFDLERRAEYNFQHQRYLKSSSDYEILHDMYPKDAEYAYFLGRSYLHSNRYLDRAAELLKFSARRNFGDDAYFYLGQAYHLNYNFEDAALAFITFQKQAGAKALKQFDVDYWINVTSNARQSVQVAQNLQIESMLAIPANAAESAFKEMNHGKFIYTPGEFRSKTDEETDYQSLMFLPNDIEVGDCVYFSSQSKKGRTGAEIYYSRKISEQDYSVPVALGDEINTCYDEAYPYFDKATSTLYFSSKGHSSSGGYDIYSSLYNSENNTWSIPAKLDFPINSVHDDYLFTIWGDNSEVTFITNRNSSLNEVEAYTLKVPSPGDYVSLNGRDDVVTYALLSPSSVVIDEPLLAQINETFETPDQAVNEVELNPKEKYAKYIKDALELQVQSDSLASISKGLRAKALNESNSQKKQELIASITNLDKESKRLQYEADSKFTTASKIRNYEVGEQLAQLTPASNNDDITVYSYNSGVQVTVEKTTAEKQNYKQGFKAAQKAGEEFASSFTIMNSSPYSHNNPIPMASIPAGLVYRIQLGAYANEIPDNTFRGLSPVSKEKSNTSTKYYVGLFISITQARGALDKVKEYGYPDAFLVSFYDQNKISVQEAREIEFANRDGQNISSD